MLYTNDIISNIRSNLSNTANFNYDLEGYALATPKNSNPRIITKELINDYVILSKFRKNLSDVNNYKKVKYGKGINLFNNPHKILERLELLAASILAGNNGVIPEFSQLAHHLKQMKVISNKQLNDLIKTYITIR